MYFINGLLLTLVTATPVPIEIPVPVPVPVPVTVAVPNLTCHSVPSNHTCDNCITVIKTIQNNSIKINQTLTELLEDIKSVCSNISAPEAKECVVIIDKIEHIDSIIFNHTDPRVVCEMLHLC